jgi:regulator of sigma E protease
MNFDLNVIWILLLLLSVLVVAHEYGHFSAARAFGVKVHEFSVGFGPLIGKFNWKGVQYSFRWILLGGFCKIAGMDIALEGSEKPNDEPGHSFIDLTLWKKIVIIAAGPFFNLFLAMILIFITAAFVGLPSNLRNPASIIEQALPGTPAFAAGFQPGDRVISINGIPVKRWVDIPPLVKGSGGKPLAIQIERQGRILVKKVTPMYNPFEKTYILGISYVTGFKRYPVMDAAKLAVIYPWIFIRDTAQALVLMIRGELKGGGMGPIGMAAALDQYTKLPIYYFIMFTIILCLSLFFFNILPIPLPLLDGGWIVILVLEWILRREFSADQKAVAQFIGLMLIAFLFIVITYGDILTAIQRFFGG